MAAEADAERGGAPCVQALREGRGVDPHLVSEKQRKIGGRSAFGKKWYCCCYGKKNVQSAGEA